MNQYGKSDLKLVYISLLLIGLFLAFNFHDANATATTTIIHNYATTSGKECFNAGNGGGNRICAEPFSGLPVGHRVTSLGFQSTGTFFSSQTRMFLYDSDGVLWHQKLQSKFTGSTLTTPFQYYITQFTVPANTPVISVGYNILSAANGNYDSIGLYDDLNGSPNNLLANIVFITANGVNVISAPANINTPSSGKIWVVLGGTVGNWDSLDNGVTNIPNTISVPPPPNPSYTCTSTNSSDCQNILPSSVPLDNTSVVGIIIFIAAIISIIVVVINKKRNN